LTRTATKATFARRTRTRSAGREAERVPRPHLLTCGAGHRGGYRSRLAHPSRGRCPARAPPPPAPPTQAPRGLSARASAGPPRYSGRQTFAWAPGAGPFRRRGLLRGPGAPVANSNPEGETVRRFPRALAEFVRSADGPTAVEYGVMLALIVVACLKA